MFGSKQVSSLRKLLTSYSSINSRQTVFASASIPQHRRFLHDCIQQKWTKVCCYSSCFHFTPLFGYSAASMFFCTCIMVCIHCRMMQFISMSIRFSPCHHVYTIDLWYENSSILVTNFILLSGFSVILCSY